MQWVARLIVIALFVLVTGPWLTNFIERFERDEFLGIFIRNYGAPLFGGILGAILGLIAYNYASLNKAGAGERTAKPESPWGNVFRAASGLFFAWLLAPVVRPFLMQWIASPLASPAAYILVFAVFITVAHMRGELPIFHHQGPR